MRKFYAILALLIFALSDCSDESQLPTEKESSGKTSDGKDLVVFGRGELEEVLFKIDTIQITETSFSGRLHFRNWLQG